ncbi:aspartate racemase [Formivibrio citricus]|uniref:Aspartate racemase n=1 Tax=Formivibrio citricus TaxID=83765 RepID=A0A1I4YPW0_9NEIS|nr:amino acid racemase [Formivibrio citricus]SFN40007.1 aspartate racemase [Formivibrio citricus]
MHTRTLGIIGGLGDLAAADIFTRLLKSRPHVAASGFQDFLLEQHPFRNAGSALRNDCSLTSRKLYVFQVCQSFAERHVDAILLPCFASHTFRDEIQTELEVPLLDMMEALERHIAKRVMPGSTLGILTSDCVRQSGLFEKYFGARYSLVYPAPEQQAVLMDCIYGDQGVQSGQTEGRAMDQARQVCRHLLEQGADLLVPGFTELSLLASGLQQQGIDLPNCNEIYAEFAQHFSASAMPAPFRLGIVGGVGPAATVDFMNKIIRNTPAGCDQDHIKIVVEQNPQIPDRTACLVHHKTDPTVALLAACRRLEAAGAQAIAIPCNTAHAFVGAIQPSLEIPIINMLHETIAYIVDQHGQGKTVGLLATSGTIASKVYHAVAEAAGVHLIAPAPEFQQKVMDAIYSEHGVKAGFTDGQCKTELVEAIAHLAESSAEIMILGCTELPLLLQQTNRFPVGDKVVALIDPTEVLAQKCVRLANGTEQISRPRP